VREVHLQTLKDVGRQHGELIALKVNALQRGAASSNGGRQGIKFIIARMQRLQCIHTSDVLFHCFHVKSSCIAYYICSE